MKVKLRDYWNRIGLKYADTWKVGGRKYISIQEEEFIKNSIKNFNGNKIVALDIGCGTGRILSVLENSSKIDSICALDFNKEMLEYCARIFKRSKKIKNLYRPIFHKDFLSKIILLILLPVLEL